MSLKDIIAEIEATAHSVNPANIIAGLKAIEAKVVEYEARIASLETTLETALASFAVIIPTLEVAIPQLTPQIEAALAMLKSLNSASNQAN